MFDEPVIIVGTTPDYVLKIHDKYPGSALFLMDRAYRDDSDLRAIEGACLLFSPHDHFEKTLESLDAHLSVNRLSPRGVACFDCESLVLANRVAAHRGLPFPSLEAILRARNKMESRRVWREAGIPCPEGVVASNLQMTLDFFRMIRKETVLKPLSGSGSDLLFHCRGEKEIEEAVKIMGYGLSRRRSHPLYRRPAVPEGQGMPDPCRSWLAEEFIAGPEYSCDFLLRHGEAVLLRETEKIKARNQTFGSMLAYVYPPRFPEDFDRAGFPALLAGAASSLGFDRGHFMVDYILHDGGPVMIEMTPRPGGDSIPDLVETATGRDMLGTHLNIMAGKYDHCRDCGEARDAFASINLYAEKEGLLRRLDASKLSGLPFVRKVVMKRAPGDLILFPPEDYESRLLGYCIVSLEGDFVPEAMQERLLSLLDVSITALPERSAHGRGR